MADSDITGFTANTTPAVTDVTIIVDDPAGTPVTQKITLSDLLKVINGLTEDTSPDEAADYLLSYDASAGAAKKVLMNLIGGSGGGEARNYLINGGFLLWQRMATPGTPVAMSDDAYNGPDRWYSLIQGANATIGRNAGIGTSQYSCKLTAGGTTNRYGIAQIISAENSIPLRGQTVIAQCKVKPVNNAGSGTRDYRIAILEWTGTADTVTSEVVNNWTSGTYTTGNFFTSTTLTLVGTAAVTATHNTETALSISGAVSTSCNNLIVFIWTEDAPTHASDYVLIGEAGLYISSSVQTWKPELEAIEKQRAYYFGYLLTHSGVGRAESTVMGDVVTQFPAMRVAPTASIQGTIKMRDLSAAATRTATTPSINSSTIGLSGMYIEITAASWSAANFTSNNLVALMCDAGNGIFLTAEL